MRRRAVLLGVTILLVLISVVLAGGQSGEGTHRWANREVIYIYGDSAFTCENGVVSGCGTREDPYVIEGWRINAGCADFGINIEHTTRDFTIRNCIIEGASGAGIRFSMLSGGSIEGCQLLHNERGILFENARRNGIIGNLIGENRDGVVMTLGSRENTVSENTFLANERAGHDPERRNLWYCGYTGNYWSNYEGCDSDGNGIGDEPYALLGDRYPLMVSPLTCTLPLTELSAAHCLTSTKVIEDSPLLPGFRVPGCTHTCGPECTTTCVHSCGPSCAPDCTHTCGSACIPTCVHACGPACAPTCTQGSGPAFVSSGLLVCKPVVEAIVDHVLTCARPAVTLAANVSGGIPPCTIEWRNPQGIAIGCTPCVNVREPGTYVVSVTGSDGCVVRQSVIVAQDIAPPLVRASVDGPLTCDTTEVTLLAKISGGTPPYEIAWRYAGGGTFGNSASIDVSRPGAYTVTVTGANGCASSDSVTVAQDVAPPRVQVSADGMLSCAVTEVSLTADISGGLPPYVIEWSRPGMGVIGNTSRVTVREAGSYAVTVTGANGCSMSSSVIVAEDVEPPVVDASVDGILTCGVAEVTLVADVAGGRPPYVVEWTTPDGLVSRNAVFQAREPGLYAVTVIGANGCSGTDRVTVEQDVENPTVDAGPNRQIAEESPEVTLTATIGSYGPYTATWRDMNGDVVGRTDSITVNQSGTYEVTVVRDTGCSSSDKVTVSSELVSRVSLDSAIEGLAVFGQLTWDGVAIPLSDFYLRIGETDPANPEATTPTISLADVEGKGFKANGAEINYIIPGNATVRFSIHRDQFVTGKKYWLEHLPIDPPGEASLTFF